jgi:hypothetical protein
MAYWEHVIRHSNSSLNPSVLGYFPAQFGPYLMSRNSVHFFTHDFPCNRHAQVQSSSDRVGSDFGASLAFSIMLRTLGSQISFCVSAFSKFIKV